MSEIEKERKRKSKRKNSAAHENGAEESAADGLDRATLPDVLSEASLSSLANQLEALSAENATVVDATALGEAVVDPTADAATVATTLAEGETSSEAVGLQDLQIDSEDRISEMTAALAKLSEEGRLEEPNLDFIDGPAEAMIAHDEALHAADGTEVLSADGADMSSEALPENPMVVGEPEQLPMLGMEETTTSLDGESVEASDDEEEPRASDEPVEFVDNDKLISVIESLLFATDKPVSIATMKVLFKGTNIKTRDIQRALDGLASGYAAADRGVSLEEIHGGYQLRTKVDNNDFLKKLAKVRPFRLSGPALEVLAIAAYKQPITKTEVDQIRGVESGHLMRALMERGLVGFGEKSDLPGRPMTYVTTRKFLETFGLRNIKELPTLAEIDQLLPEGIGAEEEKETLSDVTDSMSQAIGTAYSEGEDELQDISESLKVIDTTSEFFEQEKIRQRVERDQQRAQDIRDKITFGDEVEDKDRRWLARFEAKQEQIAQAAQAGEAGGPLIVEDEETSTEGAMTAEASAGGADNALEGASLEGELESSGLEKQLAALSEANSGEHAEGDDDDLSDDSIMGDDDMTDELAVNPDFEDDDSETRDV